MPRKMKEGWVMSGKPVKTNTIRFESGGTAYDFEIPLREYDMLLGPPAFLPLGDVFLEVLGVYDNYSIAEGMPKDSRAVRPWRRVYNIAGGFLSSVQATNDLLSFDYSYSLPKRGIRRARRRGSGFHVRGLAARIDAQPRGFCTLELHEPPPESPGQQRLVEVIDMRTRESIETDDWGILRIHKQPIRCVWPEILPPLLAFLKANECEELVLRHI